MAHRVEKVAAQLQEELSAILVREVKDPRLTLISVVEVDVSPDLRNARVHVSTLGGERERMVMMEVLEHARGFIRHELAERLRSNMRRVPELRFVSDRNIEYAAHINEVLRDLDAHQVEEGSGGG